ncbi:hypothetical protein [Streptomyces sp. NPDC048272]|uniref:hypothetical protein n=1 Tax=Streptomyces sp. NPDC048272 TaxID=3154616 RepID=UPI00344AB51A
MPTKSRLGSRGHVPVAVYSCAADPAVRSGAVLLGRRYAEARLWLVATVRSDDDPSMPLDDRVGWTAILDALRTEAVRGVVVAKALHSADSSWALDTLGSAVREHGGFLAEAIGTGPRAAQGGAE